MIKKALYQLHLVVKKHWSKAQSCFEDFFFQFKIEDILHQESNLIFFSFWLILTKGDKTI